MLRALIAETGPRAAILFPGLGMLLIVVGVAAFSRLRDLDEPAPVGAPGA
jgi:hypothetical protein